MSEVSKGIKFLLWYKDPSIFFRDIYRLEPYPYQVKILKRLAVDPKPARMLFMAASGTGKTKLLACIALWLTVVRTKFTKKPYSVIIISGSRDQAKNLYDYCKFAIKDTPYILEDVEGEPLISRTAFKDRSEILAVPNSLRAIQGKHNDCVIIDESVLAGDFIIRDALRIISSSSDDLVILSGTPMEYSSLFVEMWEDTSKYKAWERFHWTAKECIGITAEKWAEATNLPPEMFSIFWEGNPYAVSGTLINPESLKKAYKDIEKLERDDSHEVVAGIDWGFKHPTVIVVVQRDSDGVHKILYVEGWSRELFKDLHKRIQQICEDYHVSRVYCDSEDIGENQRLEDLGLNVTAIKFKRDKIQMQSHLKLVFYQEKILIPEVMIELTRQLKRYNWDVKEDDDYVDALQLALWALREEEITYFHEVI